MFQGAFFIRPDTIQLARYFLERLEPRRTSPSRKRKRTRIVRLSLITLRSSSSLRGTPLEKLRLTSFPPGSLSRPSSTNDIRKSLFAERTRETLYDCLKMIFPPSRISGLVLLSARKLENLSFLTTVLLSCRYCITLYWKYLIATKNPREYRF